MLCNRTIFDYSLDFYPTSINDTAAASSLFYTVATSTTITNINTDPVKIILSDNELSSSSDEINKNKEIKSTLDADTTMTTSTSGGRFFRKTLNKAKNFFEKRKQVEICFSSFFLKEG